MTRAALVVLALLMPGALSASEAAREALVRFDRGMKLVNDRDNAGAVAEFRRAFELSGEPEPLFNLGIVYSFMNRPVEAVAALDRLLAAPQDLDPAHLARARKVRDAQAARLGRLEVKTNVPAQITLDNFEVGRAPQDKPLPVAAGAHIVAVVAPGYEPARRPIDVAAGETRVERFELVSIAGRLGHLRIASALPGAEVWIDGKLVGTTPLESAVSLPPGRREISLRRAGYQPVVRTVSLGDGATESLELVPEPAGDSISQAARLRLRISEPGAEVAIDGRRQRVPAGGVQLPIGRHRINVARSGFYPLEREIVLDRPGEHDVQITLEPTEETRYDHGQRARAERLRAYIALGAGALVAGAGGFLVARAESEHEAARGEHDEVAAMLRVGGQCYLGAGAMEIMTRVCEERVNHANQRLDSANTQRWIARATLGVGAALVLTGVGLRLFASDPERYELRGLEVIASGPGGSLGAGLHGRF